MKRNLASTFLVLLICLFALPASGQRTITPADTLRFAGVNDAQISPDGDWVVYTVSTTESNTSNTTLMLARINNPAMLSDRENAMPDAPGTVEQLLPAGMNGSGARWSPDGKRIAFFASREKQSGIWVVTLGQRRPQFVAPVASTNFFITYAGESLDWSPDSRRIAFISASEEPLIAATPPATPRTAAQDDPRIVDRIQYKSRTSFSDRSRTHVWVVDVDAALAGDEASMRQLTSGPFYDHALTWNPRGDEVAFLSNHEPDPDAFNNSDIYAVDMSGRVRQITDTRGCEYEPKWSPDGKWIAYTATKREVTTIDSVAEDTHVWVIGAGGGAGRELTARQDRRARSPKWAADSRSIFFLAGDHGTLKIYATELDGGGQSSPLFNRFAEYPVVRNRPATVPRYLSSPPPYIQSFSVSSRTTPTLSFILSDTVYPGEVWVGSPGPRTRRPDVWRVSAHNDALVNSLTLSLPEAINFRSFDGTPVQGWLMKPANWRADRRYPLILSIHGGPHGMYGYSFNPAFQAYAARGYAVLYLNPRGSSGYGQKFSDGTLREWGGGDYRDLMLGVDEALRTRPWIDPDRLGVTGGSYGGFMTNWIITQTTRFRAAVAAASVSNLISFYATSLYQDLVHAEFGGFPWDDYDQLWRWSPLRYAKQAQTPTLFLHGEQDNDVHITQAEEMYMALKRRGIETVLARYPREGHGLREPAHRQDALERTLAWFDKFLK
ncbi:MAG TPA: S9 family peptidase [Pyrinomonadaceae bacterium]|nr:S9 family peptidase [Pyrinomonadaceae bacterium]